MSPKGLAGASAELEHQNLSERFLTTDTKILTDVMTEFPTLHFRLEHGQIHVLSTLEQFDAVWQWFWQPK